MDAFEELQAAVSMATVKKTIPLPNGKDFVFYISPMTLGEREKARRHSKKDDSTDFALRLLVDKALDENNEKRFNVGHIAGLKHSLPSALVEKIVGVILDEDIENQEEVQEELTTKSNSKTVKKGKPITG